MKVKIEDLASIRRLINQDTPESMELDKIIEISNFAAKIIEQDRVIDSVQKKLEEKHTDKADKKKIDIAAYNKEFLEYLKTEIELPDMKPLKIAEIRGMKLTPVQLAELMRLGIIIK